MESKIDGYDLAKSYLEVRVCDELGEGEGDVDAAEDGGVERGHGRRQHRDGLLLPQPHVEDRHQVVPVVEDD